MPYKMAIASGKGGTGKTTVAVSLFNALYHNFSQNIQLVDCDVEEPNDIIFFKSPEQLNHWEITQLIPEIEKNDCTYCRKCVEYCEFNAIVVIPPVEFTEVNANLCHSCGACLVACQYNAITEKTATIGQVNLYNTGIGLGVLEGRLKVGSAMQTMLIKELKKKTDKNADLLLLDAPPGTSCPVVETVSDADFVILVTEPTPFGLHDLKLTIELLNDIQKPYGIVINKAGLGNNAIYQYIHKNKLDLLGEIPYSKAFAANYAKGGILSGQIPENINKPLKHITAEIGKHIEEYEGNNYFKW